MGTMRRLRLASLAFGLALALAIGQQLVLQHALEHVVVDTAQGDALPGTAKCDEHSLFASAANAVGSAPPAEPYLAAVVPPASDVDAPGVDLAPRRTFLSHAPPASLA